MTGLDMILAALALAATVLGYIRGFGVAVLDLLAFYCALLCAGFLATMIGHSLPTIGGTGPGFANLEILVLLIVSGVFLVIAKFSHNALLWNAGMFDRFGGAIAGCAAGVVFCHALVSALAFGDNQQASAMSGQLTQQLLTFSDYHDMIDGLKNAITPPVG